MGESSYYPGHMAKARRQMQDDIRLVDVVVEITDARAPAAARNPYLDELWARKPRVLVLGKADLADEAVTKAWKKTFQNDGLVCLAADIRKEKAAGLILKAAAQAAPAPKKGRLERPLRLMVVGLPNVGKSTLINRMAGRSEAVRTGNKPGVTRTSQWIRVGGYGGTSAAFGKSGPSGTLLLDTPGMLWPKMDDKDVVRKLSLLGLIGDEKLDLATLSSDLLEYLQEKYPQALSQRYGIDVTRQPQQMLEEIAVRRGYRKSAGELDLDRTTHALIDEFRSGRIGHISLEAPHA